MDQSGVRTNLTVTVAWCPQQDQVEIFELQTAEDFHNCQNFPDDPMSFPSQDDFDGFIVAGPETKYYASNKCKEGFKVKIDFF